MDIFQKYKKVFLFVGIFLAILALYYLFFSGSDSDFQDSALDPVAGGLVSELSVSPSNAIIGREMLLMLAELKSIELKRVLIAMLKWNGLKKIR